MSMESAKACIAKLKSDPAFGKSLEAAKTDAERIAFMKKAGFDFTKDEFKQAVKAAKGKSELSEKDLAKVAGGTSATWVGVGAGVRGAVASAAAAF
jgi:predicted ribosomally synthesized peptide with nif11-like leader